MKYAEILFPQKIGLDKETLTYHTPDKNNLKQGHNIKAPIRNKLTNGIVWKIHNKKPSFKTLAIKDICQSKPLLSTRQIDLIKWISSYYSCPLFKTLKLFIPKRILLNKPFKTPLTSNEQINRTKIKQLTEEQEKALNAISTSKVNNFLIHGITGSGKTELYCRIAQEHIKNNKQVLILVPEISLTPQTINYFEKSLGIKATTIHSKLSEGERYHAWNKIHKNEAKLIIGSRSAIFSPFQRLALIIIDEEHEFSYKQDQSPRYKTHDVAKKMQELDPEIKIIYGSATPSIETAEKLKNSTLYLKNRIGNSSLPQVEIVDLREEFKKKNYSIFSEKLHFEIENILTNKEQAILFLNRRGSASSVVCRDCGFNLECKNCEIPMTFHSKTLSNPSLICHHCGKIEKPIAICPQCKGPNIRFLGIGTQKIESELLKTFPEARVLRADKDTTSTKHGFEKIYNSFKNHEADILIGTQMISKGLHLPKVNLVGVILADIGLNIPDFRSAERNFQLMSQVAGRAGRSNNRGKVIIQTYNPDNIALLCAKNHDYDKFFNYERTQRKLLQNPPFSQLAKITIQNKNLKQCSLESEKLENKIFKILRKNNLTKNFEILTYPAYITKLRGKYRYITLIKAKNNAVHNLLEKLPKEYIINANTRIDIDPIITS